MSAQMGEQRHLEDAVDSRAPLQVPLASKTDRFTHGTGLAECVPRCRDTGQCMKENHDAYD
jgi:hypothetical protein